jgi:TPR repeat protein
MNIFTRLVCALCLLACVFAAAARDKVPDTDYNRGVSAFQTKDYLAARKHWSKAVASGEVDAFNNLGFLLYNGLGGPRDEQGGIHLWLQAAQMAQAESQWHLANAYESGKGIRSNDIEAYAWYACAVAAYALMKDRDYASQAAKDAKRSSEKLLERLPQRSRQAAETLAKSYISLYAKSR